MAFTQDNRLLAVDTPLGKDVLLLTAFKGKEGISRLFDFDLTMLSENHNISFEAIIGQSVTIAITLADGGKRYFNGIVSSFSQGRGGGDKGGDPRFSYYAASVVPWTWILTRTADSRIFQKKSVRDIIKQIFNEKGLTDFSDRLSKSYEPKEYCVQYRETDFNFISRLMEEEGIWYFFEHANGKHTMVLADDPGQNKPCPNQADAHYQISAGGWMEKDIVRGFEKSKEIRPGKYTLRDYDFKKPKMDLTAEVPTNEPVTSKPLPPSEREIYDYHGRYETKADGERLSKLRMEEEEMQITSINGTSICRAFTSGYRFKILDHYRGDMNNKDYVLVTLEHQVSHSTEYSGTDALSDDESFTYSNNFTCIPHEVPFRPPLAAEKPVVRGSHSAIVVGPKGEEIYTNEHGQVKVQFPWDREGKNDENSSCWIRVSQLWAGENWGAMYIPRIGHEVIVDFYEGDPDRPLITGRVYHGNNKPPYPLPAEKTKSTIKSNSSKGGGGFNEFRFEDKKGQEEVYLHGQKDWTIMILNDKNQTIGHDETMLVKNNRTKTVQVNQKETIGNNKTIMVGVNHSETIGSNMTLTVGINKTETVGVNSMETVGAAKILTIGAAYAVSVGGAMSETVGAVKSEQVGGDRFEEVGGNKEVKIEKDLKQEINGNTSTSVKGNTTVSVEGNQNLIVKGNRTDNVDGNLDVHSSGNMTLGTDGNMSVTAAGNISESGTEVSVTGTSKITLSCGASSIEINPGMITISSPMVKINC